ncbi:MAG: hypothetical protein IJ766_01115 [Clostridia bacterium]|nr:hypothetical protein [Clostridia bacterium]
MYYFYLDNILLPVTPGSLTVKVGNNNKTLDLASGGAINIPKSPGLTEVTFDMLLPAAAYSFARYTDGYQPPDYYLGKLEQLKGNKQAFDFIVIRSAAAETLRYSARLSGLPDAVMRQFDRNGDGKVNSADARILLRSAGAGTTVLSPTRMRCLLEDYTVTEDAEKQGRDFTVAVKLKQYVEYGLKKAYYTLKG